MCARLGKRIGHAGATRISSQAQCAEVASAQLGRQNGNPWQMREEDPQTIAAAVNGIVVMLGPALIVYAGMMIWPNMNPPVRPPGASSLTDGINAIFLAIPLMSPFAAVAAWRTWVHAKKRRERGTSGLQGVAEGALFGFFVVAVPLMMAVGRSGRATESPRIAMQYVLAYAIIGLLVGLAFGVILWFTAALVLKLCAASSTSARPPQIS